MLQETCVLAGFLLFAAAGVGAAQGSHDDIEPAGFCLALGWAVGLFGFIFGGPL